MDEHGALKYRTWIELDRQAIFSNVETFRSLVGPDVKLLGVVKSNAYGHGFVDFTKYIIEDGVDWIGVDSFVEGLRLRKEGITKPILVLGYTLPERIKEAVAHDISISISNMSTVEAIRSLDLSEIEGKNAENTPRKVKVHVKADTGMYRQGFLSDEMNSVIESLKDLSDKIQVEGLFTHFASAKNPSFPDYTLKQIAKFEDWRNAFAVAGFAPIVHASATSGTILFAQAHYDMVRIGIGLYGLWPSQETKEYAQNYIELQPVLSWKTIVSEVKKVPAGERIGYDGTEILRRDSVLAVCPVGYWHGYPRSMSSIGEVILNGKTAKIIGRVSMDMIIIDVTDCEMPSVLDEVVLIGTQGQTNVSAERFASLADASWYEIVTRINPLIHKFTKLQTSSDEGSEALNSDAFNSIEDAK